ncbi:hypothetical protein [Caldifermentibacillus hisashii]
MAKRNIEYNKLDQQIQFIHGDLKEMLRILGYNQFDVVTCNPTYHL